MATITEPRLLSWAIPTPQGLWYRSIVMIQQGVFVTPTIDTRTLESIKGAARVDTATLVELLTSHRRFKRPEYLPWSSITGVRHDSLMGTIEIEGAEKLISMTVPDRNRLEKLARVIAAAWRSQAARDAERT